MVQAKVALSSVLVSNLLFKLQSLIMDSSYLPPQLNSFYCTINSPLVNQLFQEEIIESQSYLKDIHCDTQRRICQTCLKQSCWNVEKNNINNNNNINVQSEMSVRQNLQNDVIGSHGDIGINNNNDVNNMNNNNHRVTSENLLQVNDIVQNLWAVNGM
ncbi:unnamed protein product [Trichobilharzia regenti]|nr:unnamed protein product [Trichobilharzia regenti]